MDTLNTNDINISTYEGEVFDRTLHSVFAKYFGMFSPVTLVLSYFDWFAHIMICPAKQLEIRSYFFESNLNWCKDIFDSESCEISLMCQPTDQRFKHPGWNDFPYSLYARLFLMYEDLWSHATQNVRGVEKHHQQVVHFLSRQLLDVFAPSNVPWMNPEVIEKTIAMNGSNFTTGFRNMIDDYLRFLTNSPAAGTEKYKVGVDVAITPGKVIYRNGLIELIQYLPTTGRVSKEPVLIIPAWIMKYYILDLSPQNSMVKYLVEQGHTVFMISWKNPDAEDRDLGLNSYINQGIMPALNIINQIVPNTKVNAVGYCLGGTLLMIAAAVMAANNDERIASITLLAGQIDFKDAGELTLLIDTSQVAYLEDIMWEKGYLDGAQMAGTFSMLHSSELIWSRMVREYLLGERTSLNDIMAWDNDTTRMPFRMHSEYLRKLFLNNDLVQGVYAVDDKYITLSNISVPIFAVGTLTDHVAPWKSVYKVHLFTKSDITFVLTNGGHNAGIVSEPGHPGRSYQMLTSLREDTRITVDEWQKRAPTYDGSWWLNWHNWLHSVSSDVYTTPPEIGDKHFEPVVLCDAPGTYVLQK